MNYQTYGKISLFMSKVTSKWLLSNKHTHSISFIFFPMFWNTHAKISRKEFESQKYIHFINGNKLNKNSPPKYLDPEIVKESLSRYMNKLSQV